MKIAILTSSYPRFPGDGTAPFIQSIAEHLAKLGHDVEIVAPHDPEVSENNRSYSAAPPTPQYWGEQQDSSSKVLHVEGLPLEYTKVKVHRFRYIWPERWHIMGHAKSLKADVRLRPLAFFLLPFFLVGALIKLMQVTREQNSQIIHVNWVLPNGPAAALVARIRKIPYVVSLHGSDMYVAQKNPIFSAAAQWVFRRADAVTSCSTQLLEAAQSLDAPDASHLITWGADPEKFHPKPQNLDLARSWGFRVDDIHIVTLGRLVHKKGFNVLIRAFAELASSHPGVRLVIGGEGPLYASLEQIAQNFNIQSKVIFPGRIPWDQVIDFFALGEIFVLPSIQDAHGNVDGLPTVLFEALACGLPVVASNIGGVQLVIEDGKNGLLVLPGDGEALKEALQRLLKNTDERIHLAQAARQSVVNEHVWDAVARKFSRIFHDAIQ